MPGTSQLSDAELVDILQSVRTIAVVGASADAAKAAHAIPAYMKAHGYRIIPVNPRGGEILGERVFPSLAEVDAAIDVPIDMVDVFRPAREAETVARAAIAAGARVLWFQLETDDPAAVRLAEDAGLTVVTGRCLAVEHRRLGLGRGPARAAAGPWSPRSRSGSGPACRRRVSSASPG